MSKQMNWQLKYELLTVGIDDFLSNGVLERGDECPFCDVDMLEEELEAHASECPIRKLGEASLAANRA